MEEDGTRESRSRPCLLQCVGRCVFFLPLPPPPPNERVRLEVRLRPDRRVGHRGPQGQTRRHVEGAPSLRVREGEQGSPAGLDGEVDEKVRPDNPRALLKQQQQEILKFVFLFVCFLFPPPSLPPISFVFTCSLC